MADSKITDFTALTAVDINADYLEIVDVSAGTNKKILPKYLGLSLAWELANSWTFSANVANVDFTGLADYTELLVLQRLVICSTSGRVSYRVSSDNGATFLSTSGDYQFIAQAGTETADTGLKIHSTDSTSARSGVFSIVGWKLAAPKPLIVARNDFIGAVIPGASALNALRAIPSNGGNLTAGSIYVFGR